MGNKKVQFGASLTGDLTEGTWTFEVENLELKAGEFAILRKDEYLDLMKQRDRLLEELKHVTLAFNIVNTLESGKEIARGAKQLIQSIEQ